AADLERDGVRVALGAAGGAVGLAGAEVPELGEARALAGEVERCADLRMNPRRKRLALGREIFRPPGEGPDSDVFVPGAMVGAVPEVRLLDDPQRARIARERGEQRQTLHGV